MLLQYSVVKYKMIFITKRYQCTKLECNQTIFLVGNHYSSKDIVYVHEYMYVENSNTGYYNFFHIIAVDYRLLFK